MISKKNFNLVNIIVGLLTFVIASIVYIYTSQSTVAFWDCGEYAGASAIMGIPHPPGNPLFIIIGRVVVMALGFIDDVGFRLNFFNAIVSALSVMMVYFVSTKIITLIKDELSSSERLFAIVGSFAGAMFLAFSNTWWFNSVESEVYALAMFFVLLETWFVLKWYENKDSEDGNRFLYAMVYFSVLGMGIHMYTMLVLPPIALFYFMVKKEEIKDFRLLATLFIIGYGIIAPKPFMWGLALLLTVLPFLAIGRTIIGKIVAIIIAVIPIGMFLSGFIPYENDLSSMDMWMITIAALVVILSTPILRPEANYKKWKFLFAFVALAAVGYSVQAFIPLRAASTTLTINENEPDDWVSFKDFLERKQYGDESMFQKMLFKRQGSLINQFGGHARMGFGGFFVNQYGDNSISIGNFKIPYLFFIPGLLGLYALFIFYKRDKNLWIFISSLVIICTIGLTLYMNFSDGTRGVRLEVRDRDYFWTPGFMYFSNLIAIGFFIVLSSIKRKELLASVNDNARKAISAFLVALVVLAPFKTLAANWDTHNRHNNYFPYDYAYNLLNSCEEGGILFTNGDNDTFPLWYLQEAAGVRKDVIVANLSLLNTPWYIKQLVKKGLPTFYSQEEIEKIAPTRGFDTDVLVPLANAGIKVKLLKDERSYLKVQDLMVLNIVDANKWKRPIYFAITVGQNNYMGLYEYMKMEGMVYKVMDKKPTTKVNRERTLHLLDSVYQYRGLENNSDVYLMQEDEKLITNYGALFIMLSQDYLQDYYQLKNEIAILERNLNDSSVVASYEPEMLEARKAEYAEAKNNIKSIQNTVLKIMESGKNQIGKTDFVLDYFVRYLEEFGLKDSANNVIKNRVLTSVNPDAKTYARYFSLISEGKVDSMLNQDSIVEYGAKMHSKDGSVNLLAGEYFETKNMLEYAIIYYEKAAKSKDARVVKLAKAKIQSMTSPK